MFARKRTQTTSHAPTLPPLGASRAMSVQTYTDRAKSIQEDVSRILDAGLEASKEKKARGLLVMELLSMASVVRYQIKAIEHGKMSKEIKELIKPPDMETGPSKTITPATEYIKSTLIECKERIVDLHNENRSLRRALRDISKRVQWSPEDTQREPSHIPGFWDDDKQMGKILEELDLEEEEN